MFTTQNVLHCIDIVDTNSYIKDKNEVIYMAKTANINVRIDPETKKCAEELFSRFGITITDAINIFLHKSIMEGGLPFEMKQPKYNAETEAAIREARLIMSGQIDAKHYSSAHELFDDLEQESC